MVELIPCRAPIEVGVAAASSFWWAFNLVFSMTLIHLAGESTPIGLPGLCAIHAVVASLLYAFILQALPPCKQVHNLSMCQIERYFDIKYNSKDHEIHDSDNLSISKSGVQLRLKDSDLTSTTSDAEDRRSSTST